MNNSPQDQADSTTKQEKNNTKEKLPLTHVIVSVLAAAIGVQSKKNQEKDFTAKGSIVTYIAAGIIFTIRQLIKPSFSKSSRLDTSVNSF